MGSVYDYIKIWQSAYQKPERLKEKLMIVYQADVNFHDAVE